MREPTEEEIEDARVEELESEPCPLRYCSVCGRSGAHFQGCPEDGYDGEDGG